MYNIEVPKISHKIPHPKSYFKAKEVETNIENSLHSIRSLQNRLSSVWEFKDKKDTFGGTSERKLPFEVKKESVMSMQNWVKIDQVEQPATSGWETGILNNHTV